MILFLFITFLAKAAPNFRPSSNSAESGGAFKLETAAGLPFEFFDPIIVLTLTAAQPGAAAEAAAILLKICLRCAIDNTSPYWRRVCPHKWLPLP